MYVVTQNFSGHGLVEATGGNGFDLGYGGAGGRIAIHVQWFKEFSGNFQAFGGFSGKEVPDTDETRNGAAGTVYTTDSNSIGLDKKEVVVIDGVTTYIDGYTYLLLDNDNRNHVLGTVIMRDEGTSPYVFEFDEVEANNHVVLWIGGDDSELLVHLFNGDRTGLMHAQGNQKIYVEYVESTLGYTVAPVSLKIESSAEVILPSTTFIYGSRTELSGLLTMVQNLTVAEGATCLFTSTARTALIERGIYVHQSDPSNIYLSHLTIQRGSVVIFTEKEGTELTLNLIKLSLKYEGLVYMNAGTINSSNAVVESLGILNVDFQGYDAGQGFGAGYSDVLYGFGAAHGGHGGAPEPEQGGIPYDSVYKPIHPGSGGGGRDNDGSLCGGRGGGYLHWNIGGTLWIDGEVTLEGESGQGLNCGGGSGGGLFIHTTNFTGFGLIDCHGGNGSGDGGGGSGGRIAIHIDFSNRYIGRLYVTGGIGSGVLPSGAAGTVYLQENERGPQYADVKYDELTGEEIITATHRRLEVDNHDIDKHLYVNHREPWLYTSLFEEEIHYEFDELELKGHANVWVEYPTDIEDNIEWKVVVKIHKFHGDRTGVFRLRELQRLYVEVIESQSNETIAPCSFRVDNGSEIFMPTTTNLLGSRTVIAGLVTGVLEMMVRGGASLFMSTGRTAFIENREYVMVTGHGNFTFAILRIMAGARAEFRDITGVCVISVSEFYVKYQALLLVNFVMIESSYVHIESQGELTSDGVGSGAEQGLGAGYTLQDGITGSGAGHGGFGGGPAPEFGGIPYNSIFWPLEPGSGGGNGNGVGGSGGGYLEWNVADLIEVNGLLTVSGTDGTGGNAGGGSGGSILMNALNVSGHGIMAVVGGNAAENGYGGSGGRIAINCRFRYSYGGEYHNYGGLGFGENGTHSGASGTTFVEENLRKLEYRQKKYDPVHNTTFLEVDHHLIHSRNNFLYSLAPTYISDPGRKLYEFDEMDISETTYVWFHHPDDIEEVEVIVHKFLGDKSGTVHIRENEKLWVEYVESVSNKTEAPVSYIIDEGAEVVFPSELHLHGTRTTFAGTMTGVNNMFIEDGASVEFMSTGNTASLLNGEYFDVTNPGSFSWDQLHIKRKGNAGFLDIGMEEYVTMQTSEIKVKYQGNLYMNRARINSTYSWIESEGVFHLNGHGYASQNGPGAGFTDENGIGYGAAHGGYGGGSDPNIAPLPYGSIFSPMEFGSGGGDGSGTGGNGGGVLHWITSHYFELMGTLALQGTNGQGANAGGGSGGSLLIESMNFTGHGIIDTAGGNGTGRGGGGAGGRAAIHCEVKF